MAKRVREEEEARIVTLSYDALVRGDDLSAEIEAAYGVDGLGILTVSDVPGMSERRAALLPLASRFAALSNDVKAKYEVPSAYYAVGWSHGREKLQGRPDYAKGSYYANPLHNAPFEDPADIERYPAFAAPNVWPEELPALEHAFMDMGQLVHKVGCLVAAQCDRYVRSKCPGYPASKLADVLTESKCCKARLLHYFPTAEAAVEAAGDEDEAFSSWCGWHNDHGSLTGLVPAMFFDHAATATAGADAAAAPMPLKGSPDEKAGLYIRGRKGQLVKPPLPPTHLGFQIGETAQVHSGGWLQATPHAVRGCAVPHVSRATFAVFMEPEWGYPMQAPEGVDPDKTQSSNAANFLPKGVPPLRSRWGTADCPFTTCNFGEFTDSTMKMYLAGA